jgi:hypothetical protein
VTAHRGGLRRHHLLGFLPTAGMLGGIPFVNRVHPLVLGMPALFAWIAAWVVATSLIMWIILKLDRAQERAQRDATQAPAEAGR